MYNCIYEIVLISHVWIYIYHCRKKVPSKSLHQAVAALEHLQNQRHQDLMGTLRLMEDLVVHQQLRQVLVRRNIKVQVLGQVLKKRNIPVAVKTL